MVHGQAIGIPFRSRKVGQAPPKKVAWNPTIESNLPYKEVDCYIDSLPAVVGNYYPINSKLRIDVTTKETTDEVTSLVVNGVSFGTPNVNDNRFTFNGTLPDKSHQKINITIDEYVGIEGDFNLDFNKDFFIGN